MYIGMGKFVHKMPIKWATARMVRNTFGIINKTDNIKT